MDDTSNFGLVCSFFRFGILSAKSNHMIIQNRKNDIPNGIQKLPKYDTKKVPNKQKYNSSCKFKTITTKKS